MEPIVTTHRGVTITTTLKPHRPKKGESKVWVEFEANGTKYVNGQIVRSNADEGELSSVYGGLMQWAHQIINENVTE